MTDDYPLYMHPVIGWRLWIPLFIRGNWLLSSLRTFRKGTLDPLPQYIWEPGERFQARCTTCRHVIEGPMFCSSITLFRHENPPEEIGECGVYAHAALHGARERFIKIEEELKRCFSRFRYTAPLVAVGTVKLWGRIIEHEWGFRAQYAYPKTLYVPRDRHGRIAAELAEAYRVPASHRFPDDENP